jgi:hypothetical protein
MSNESGELMTEDIAVVEAEILAGEIEAQDAMPAEAEPTSEERLYAEAAELRAQVTDLTADLEKFSAEVVVREQERDAAIAEADAMREKVSALKADLSRDGAVFGRDFHFKTEGAMYALETIEQRVRGAIERAGI